MKEKKELVVTSDGSHSFYINDLKEHYHSRHGALNESLHVFINNGLLEVAKRKSIIKVFEVGMGTGLNVFLTCLKAKEYGLKVNMSTIEAFPLSMEEVSLLNYPEALNEDGTRFYKIHSCKWNECIEITSNMTLTKHKMKLEDAKLNEKFDLIYFDAFAPEKQPEMWTTSIFKKLHDHLLDNGILVTYCVKGEVRRRLREIGFDVEKLKGPTGGKREVLRAIKSED